MAIFGTEENIDKTQKGDVTAGSVIKYMTLPRILPRIAELITTGFRTLAFFIACVLSTVRLIPENHAFLRPENIGNFGVIQVLATASSNLKFTRDNTDQVIVFTTIVTAIVIMALQILSLLMAFIMPSAMAQIANIFAPYPTMLPTPIAANLGGDGRFDIAMILLDRVFGVDQFFNSCVSLEQPCTGINTSGLNSANEVQTDGGTFPWAFHNGLHQMYLFYSLALLVIGVFIFIYFIMVILIETAQTGTPFGRRFNSVWAPIRMVVAVGLLIPFAYGMNSAQFITLYAAKWGSGLATTAWFTFNQNLTQLTTDAELIGTPKAQTALQLLSFMSLVHACELIEEKHFNYNSDIVTALGGNVSGPAPAVVNANSPAASYGGNRDIDAWMVKTDVLASQRQLRVHNLYYNDPGSPTATDALQFYNNGNVVVRFGDRDPNLTNNSIPAAYTFEKGQVRNACGEIVISSTDAGVNHPGSMYIYNAYFEIIYGLWFGQSFINNLNGATGVAGLTNCDTIIDAPTIHATLRNSSRNWVNTRLQDSNSPVGGTGNADYFTGTTATKEAFSQNLQQGIQCIINNGVLIERDFNANLDIPPDLLVRGWAGAGIWYNKIAATNGTIITAAGNIPAVSSYPLIMERVAKAKLRVDPNVSAGDIYDPERSKGKVLNLERNGEVAAAKTLYELYKYWNTDANRVGRASSSGNFFGEMLTQLFGLQGLYSIRENNNVHPLAKLVGVGKGLIDSTIKNLSVGTAAMFGGIVASYVDHPMIKTGGAGADIIGDVMFSVATIGLTAGFVLYYVVPFLPFIYFFFAVGNWLKTVFEAMVGVPLWALAHIRIDGNGLPGDAAINGYYLIFEIFLRPIMIIFGLIAGISVFAAMAAVLHDVWDIVLANVGGTGLTEQASFTESIRGPIDKLFYLVVYAIILYMMAVSSFKLVELIPQQILRWIGANVPSFVDQSQDAAGGLVQYAAIGGGHMFGQLTGGVKDSMSKLKSPN